MRFRFGNREKKVIGGILTILFIAGLHFAVFSRKARDYDQTVQDWRKSKRDYEDLVQKAKNPRMIEEFRKQNKKLQEEFKTLIENLHISFPGYYMDGSPESVQKRREDCIEHIEKLVDLKKNEKNAKLRFMEEGGWNIPLELPEEIRKRPERLWDVISQINGINRILKVIDNPQVREEKLFQYDELLKEIGMDEKKIEALKGYGPYVPFINRYCHYRLIIKEKPQDIKLTDQDIRDIIRISFPDDFLIKLNHQLRALIDLLEIAEKNEIEEITEIVLNEFTEIRAPVKKDESQQAQPGAPPPPPPRFQEDFFDERAMMEGMGMHFGEMGMPRMKGETAPAQTQGEFIAHGAPIRFRFTGSNLNITNFLYEITNIPRTYELDSLSVSAIKEREGVGDVYAWINVISLVDGIIVDLDSLWKEEEKKPGVPSPTGG